MMENVSQIAAEFFNQHRDGFNAIIWLIILVPLVQNLIYLIQLPVAWWSLRRYSSVNDRESSWQALLSETTIPVTVIVPAHNEASVIVESVRCLLALQYPEIEIIVVNDGSSDDTLAVLCAAYDLTIVPRAFDATLWHEPINASYGSKLYANLRVVDKARGHCKADAINAGINISRLPLFCVVDADSLLDAGALLRATRPFVEDPRRMVAVGGTIRVVNGCETRFGLVHHIKLSTRFLPLLQSMEYIRAFLMARTALSEWGILLIISGAFGVFRRDPVIEVGGYDRNTVGEDMELIVKLHHHLRDQKRDYAMRFVAEPVCWTQVPESLAVLGNQRMRWQQGSLESFFTHIRMFMNPRYGKIGMLGLPYVFLADVLGPLVEVLGYFLLPFFYFSGALDPAFFLAFTGLVIFFGVFISTTSLILEEAELWSVPRTRDLALLFFIAVIENFGYRQLNNIWRVLGLWRFLRGNGKWGEMERKAYKRVVASPDLWS